MPKAAVACLALLIAPSGSEGGASAASAPAVAVHVPLSGTMDTVTLIDSDSFAVLGTAMFQKIALPLRFDAKRRSLLVVTLPRSKKKPATLWSLDTQSIAVTSVADLGRNAQVYLPYPGSTRLYVVAETDKLWTISVFDLVALRPLGILASVERMTGLQFSPDGALLYVRCEGKTHRNPEGPPGNLHILDAMTGAELARLEVGRDASSVAFDATRGLAYVMGVEEYGETGKLTVLRGGSVVAQLDVRGKPTGLRFAPDGGSYLLTSRAVVALDADGLAARHTWVTSFGPSDLIFDPGRDLMFAGAGGGSEIAEMRMSGGEVMVRHRTGSPGRKFGHAVANVLAVPLMYGTASDWPFSWGGNTTTMLLRSDGAILYVFNRFTGDVSLYDVAKRDVVGFVDTGNELNRFVQLPGDPNFWLFSGYSLERFNTSTNHIDRTILGINAFDTARERAWVKNKATVLVIDLRSGEAVGQAELPKFAEYLWIDNAQEQEEDSLHP